VSAEPGSTSTSLLGRVRAGEADAWEKLVDLYGPLVYGWCRQSGLQGEDAADVVQEVFAAVASRIDRFRRDRPGDTWRGWLWTITRNKVLDHFRARAKQPQAPGGTDAQVLLGQVPAQPPELPRADEALSPDKTPDEYRALQLVRAGVEDRTWRAFWRVVIDGQPVADVADELEMSVRAVYEAKYRVRRRIRQELEDLIG
jgi:RNA polymerase sigma-70 factor (ECF subfamily)